MVAYLTVPRKESPGRLYCEEEGVLVDVGDLDKEYEADGESSKYI